VSVSPWCSVAAVRVFCLNSAMLTDFFGNNLSNCGPLDLDRNRVVICDVRCTCCQCCEPHARAGKVSTYA